MRLKKELMGVLSLPNLLTLSRMGAIPFIVAAFYLQSPLSYWSAGLLFVFACLTDGLDGYIARTLKNTSRLGQLLDPVADKLLVTTTLLMLTGFGQIEGTSLIPATIILCRESLISGFREILAHEKVILPSSQTARWKTTLQMCSLTLLIFGASGVAELKNVGTIGLWFCSFLTLWTGYEYTVFFWQVLKKKNKEYS